jgi:hypothetical protein
MDQPQGVKQQRNEISHLYLFIAKVKDNISVFSLHLYKENFTF